MIPNRIEAFCDLSRFVYLRESNGHIGRSGKADSSPIVVAEELDGDGRVVRSWFVMSEPNRDGFGLAAACPAHRVVSRDIRPGEPTADYNPNAEATIVQRISEGALQSIRRARDEMLADRERHIIYSQAYLDALRKADEWRANVEHLNSVVAQKDAAIKERDDQIWELKNEAELNRLSIATLQASYLKSENRKSLKEQFKVWWKRCVSKQAE